MPNPFAESQPGEQWVAEIDRFDGSKTEWRIAIVDVKGETVVAIEHDAYSSTEEFPWDNELWQRATFKKVSE